MSQDASTDSTDKAIDPDRLDAVIFDLDGVITDTASVHLDAWIRMFNDFLEQWGDDEPFTEQDYLAHVDGRPRYDGVRAFLASRGIELPEGEVSDPPEAETVCGLGNRKNDLFRAVLAEGVDPYPTSVTLVEQIRAAGMKTGLVSSSRNAGPVLEAAELSHLFAVRVDGNDVIERGLPGKPDPAMFLAAAEELGVAPARAAVVEDALSGVEAGRRGEFGLVIGVNRGAAAEQLRARGADVVVDDLGELTVAGADQQSTP
ncbi:MAG: HAD family hydrolase [Egibacteraceae bacterium]